MSRSSICENDQFLSDRCADVRRAPVCEATYARRYLRSFGLATVEDAVPRHARADRIELRAAWDAALASLRVERHLKHAICSWLSARLESPTSTRRYTRAMAEWIQGTGWRRLDWVAQRATPRLLSDYRDHLLAKRAPRTVNVHLNVLRSWYSWLHEHGLIERSPWRRELHVSVDRQRLYHRNRLGHVRRCLTADQARQLSAWCFAEERLPKVALALLLMACAGLRRGEVVAADHDWLYQDGTDRCITVQGKGSRSRSLILEPLVVRALDAHLAHRYGPGRPPTSGPLIRGRSQRLSTEILARWVAAFGASIGRPDLTPHELRRTYATLIRDSGAPLEDAQMQLGHSSPALTKDFYDVGDRRLRRFTTRIEAPLEASA